MMAKSCKPRALLTQGCNHTFWSEKPVKSAAYISDKHSCFLSLYLALLLIPPRWTVPFRLFLNQITGEIWVSAEK